jgi:hypothetical protein
MMPKAARSLPVSRLRLSCSHPLQAVGAPSRGRERYQAPESFSEGCEAVEAPTLVAPADDVSSSRAGAAVHTARFSA